MGEKERLREKDSPGTRKIDLWQPLGRPRVTIGSQRGFAWLNQHSMRRGSERRQLPKRVLPAIRRYTIVEHFTHSNSSIFL
jgi:hypothetical protein